MCNKKLIKIIILYFVIINSIFANVTDELGVFNQEEKNNLEKKIKNVEKEYKISYYIYILNKDSEVEKTLVDLKRSVIIKIVKKYKVKLYFTKDISIEGYSDEIDNLLNKTTDLIAGKDYLDYIYEVIGDTKDIINIIDVGEKTDSKQLINNTMKNIFIGILVFLIIIVLIFRYIKKYKENMKICKHCNLEMDLIDKYYEKNKEIKLYSCKICGYSKKIISLKKNIGK
ncbi:hypothetical protein [Haliovirga abyssi]|uniref:TPM domain-containing protein n=1 Tax=Haliovirga abyssi TaxID=2996794 RepID=A0AAU9DGD1_9FUSO|nr:hypothetical protein [Haliovirga abyssi]BDU49739.1 hypothetical protein HLVA_03080 [Haliovirga abyssi]